MGRSYRTTRPWLLGIEGGGTRTVALLADGADDVIARREFGPGNVRLLSDQVLAHLLRAIGREFPNPDAVGLGLAGVRLEADRERVQRLVRIIWRGVPHRVASDLEAALTAASKRGQQTRATTRVLVLSGTGSCCFGQSPNGATAKMGGWGQILGDKGSGFEIGLRGLKAAIFYWDRDGVWSRLGQRLLAATSSNAPDDLVSWVADADKAAIASLALEVFRARQEGDRIARDILRGAAESLAQDAVSCARKLSSKGAPVEFVLAGGVLRGQRAFAREVGAAIRARWPQAAVRHLQREGVWGAVEWARHAADKRHPIVKRLIAPQHDNMEQTRLAATERSNWRSRHLDRLALEPAVDLMLAEEARGLRAVRRVARQIARLSGWVASALKAGGRLFYVGAGTSGRLGILDASECPPTFRSSPGQVQGILAGGHQALTQAVEGEEDDAVAGARTVRFRGVTGRDIVVGIAASGRTPFVWGALRAARARGARTGLICFDPAVKRRGGVPDAVIAVDTGAEVLTGSTRLKAGTATKLICNCLTTLAFTRLGKVAGNRMIDLDPKNEKLKARAVRITCELSGADEALARAALERAGWVVKQALRRLARAQPKRLTSSRLRAASKAM